MRHAVTTVQVRLRIPAYRILYSMGGVEVLAVDELDEPRPAAHDLLLVRLRLSGSMLGFALGLAGDEQSEQAPEAEEPVTV